MRAWLTLARNTLMANFTYRAHILFQLLGSVVGIVVLWFFWRAVFDAAATPTIRGMSFERTFLYVALATALFVMMRSWVDWEVNWQVRSGDIVVHFFRPLDVMAVFFAGSVGSVAGNLLSITLPSLITVFLVFGAPLPSAQNLLLFIPAVLMAYLLSFLIDFLVGVTAFRTESIWGFSITKEMIVLFLSGGMVPLAFFPDPLRDALLWLPFAGLYNTPVGLLAGTLTDPGEVAGRLALQAFWLAAFYGLTRLYYGVTVRKLTVAGG